MKMSKKLAALSLAAVLALTGCGGGDKPAAPQGGDAPQGGSEAPQGGAASGAIKDLYTFETANREMEGVFILNSEKAADLNVLCNTNSGLLETDAKGQLVPAAAESWNTDDGGLTWTFKIREGLKWVDVDGNEMADCNAQDWITGLEWVMNFAKNSANNSSMPSTLIKGAEEYYQYTKELEEATPGAAMELGTEKFLEMVGIEAPDDYTLIYHCTNPAPYFDTVCTSACLYSVSAKFIESVGGPANVLSQPFDKIWSNGAYRLTEYIQGNSKTLTKNESYWDKDCTLFDTVVIKIVDDLSVGFQLYEAGELDHIDLNIDKLREIYEDENNTYHNELVEKLPRKYSYQMHINYDKWDENGNPDVNWNTAIANTNFRKAIYYGLDLTKTWERGNFINPKSCENLAYTMKGLAYTSDGMEYTDRVLSLLDFDASKGRYDQAKADECKAKAIEELTAKGVTFPVQLDFYIKAGSQDALDGATVVKEIFKNCLGEDFITFNIKTYVQQQTTEVVQKHLQSYVTNGWGADYGDIQNFLGQETYGEDTAYYSMNYSNANNNKDEELVAVYKEFTELVNKADAIVDNLDERYKAYAEAEAFMLNNALVIPYNYEVSWELSKVNDYSRSNAIYGIDNYLYKNWETSETAYTTEDYNKFKEEFYK